MGSAVPLVTYEEAPPYLHGNPYVRSGYRSYLPIRLCIRSLFHRTNETLNVWTHLLVGLYCFKLYLDDYHLLQTKSTSYLDGLSFLVMVGCIQICMFASSLYHLFNCRSAECCRKLLLGDLIGITIGISGCFFPVMHYAFHCFPHLKVTYGGGIGLLFLGAGWCVNQAWFGTTPYLYHRIVVYAVVALSGILPTLHWSLLYGTDAEIVRIFVPRIVLLYFLGAMGTFFFVTRIPEALFPGRFDFIGQSHQLWHVCAAAVFLIGHQTQQLLFLYVKEHPCPNS